MIRIPELQLMEDPQQVSIWNYTERPFIVDSFVEWFKFRKNKSGTIVDLGCGNCVLGITLTKKFKDLKILAVDGSASMIEFAKSNVKEAELEDNISVKHCLIQNLEPVEDVKTIISLGVLHHFEDPYEFWHSVKRISNNNTVKCMVLDLLRPDEDWIFDEIKFRFDKKDPVYVNDVINSLKAAFTEEEIREQLSVMGFEYSIDVHIDPIVGTELMLLEVTI